MCSGVYLGGTRKDDNGVGAGTGGTPALQPDPAASRRGRGAEAAMGSCREPQGAARCCWRDGRDTQVLGPGARRCVLQDVNECSRKVALQYLCSLSLATV